jgi:uncharacterized protein YodC (DUF2158 family)
MDTNFKQIFYVGNLVRAKSGGPQITVEGYSKKSVLCMWFNDNTIMRSSFDQNTLVLVDEDKEIGVATPSAKKVTKV